MSKKSLIQKEEKKKKMECKYKNIRKSLKKKNKSTFLLKEKMKINIEFQLLPRNSSSTRLRRRCFLTGRPRANFRFFNLSRIILFKMVNACLLPGVTKPNW
uniref:Ribosomal protein S14 n=1 Tax=Mitrastemon kanehirai TaxID=1358725 RepID=A0A4Y1MCG2_9ERIC|nr:ribosomal protein S14 [Mitrastemon yamamotoi]AWS06638.1 ribosomal protein S14 [Mitrastemon kanehirai]USS57995.1 ribosomal protein S14 [Mitrastemon yamamotoi]